MQSEVKNRSLLSSLFAPLDRSDDDDDDLTEKKRKTGIDEPIVSSSSSMCFPGSYREAGMDKDRASTSSTQVVAPVPVLATQQGFVRYGTELAPTFPGLSNAWSPQLVTNPYQFCCLPYNNTSVSSVAALDSKQQVEDSLNLPNPPQMEGLFGNIPGFVRYGTELTPTFPGLSNAWSPQLVTNPYQFCCLPYNNTSVSSVAAPDSKQQVEDSLNLPNPPQMEGLFGHIPGLRTGFVPYQAMFQNPFFPTSARGPSLNDSLSSSLTNTQELGVWATSRGPQDDYPFVPKPVRGPLLNFSPSTSITKNEEFNVSATSQGPADDTPLEGRASAPSRKRKLGSPNYLSNASINAPLEGDNNSNLELSPRHVIPPWLEHNAAAEIIQDVTPSLLSTNAETQCRYITDANSFTQEEEKEIEGKNLVLLLQKELRNTDVGNLGRIVLPKKDAEANLPKLVAKDGLILQMEDMTFSVNWRFKYRYWPNNKSRMYVMENTGDFVRTHNLQTGDLFIVYKEKSSGKYIARGKKGNTLSYTGDDRKPEEGDTEGMDNLFTLCRVASSCNLELNAANGGL